MDISFHNITFSRVTSLVLFLGVVMKSKLIWIFALLPMLLWNCADTTESAGENTLEMCQDGIDNDANGKQDCNDAGCANFCYVEPIVPDVIGAPSYKYPNGLQPSEINHSQLQRLFENWLNLHYEEDLSLDQARIKFQNQSNLFDLQGRPYSREHTVSEGIAYGMMILVALDDSPTRLMRLWNFYKAHANQNGIMHWMTYKFEAEPAKYYGASDAELDAATALLLAQRKWGDAAGTTVYLDEAKVLIENIRLHEIHTDLTLMPGDGWSSQGTITRNPGYAATGPMNSFAIATGNSVWTDIAKANYAMITRCQNSVTGVIPDWCTNEGEADGNRSRDFYMESIRMTWRLALDYYWHASPEALAISKRFSDYLLTSLNGDVGKLGQGVAWNGTIMAGDMKPMFRGTYALLLSLDPTQQDNVNYLYNELTANANNGYYEGTLQLMFAATLSGLHPRPY